MSVSQRALLSQSKLFPNLTYSVLIQHKEERELWASVLARAREDIEQSHTMGKARVIMDWVRAGSEQPGGFRFICTVLDLDESYAAKQFTKAYFLRLRKGRKKRARVYIRRKKDQEQYATA